MGLVCSCLIFAFLMGLGYFVGGSRERTHFQNLTMRETICSDMLQTQLKSFPAFVPGKDPPQMIVGEVVVASDYLKTFIAGIVNFFGGEMKTYQSLLERARREATLRVMEQARALGYTAICNLRLENADIGGGSQVQGAAMASIIASATAYHYTENSDG